MKDIPAKGKDVEPYRFHIAVSTLDCTGCGSCANVCPVGAMEMSTLDKEGAQKAVWDYTAALPEVRNPFGVTSVKNSQFNQPLLEFNGACPGCGETPYAKLVTQLFGDRMFIATATGCSQVWATCFPSMPYTPNKKGHGPAVGGSLFENNAEYGLGIKLADDARRKYVEEEIKALAETADDEALKEAAKTWLQNKDNKDNARAMGEAMEKALTAYKGTAVSEIVASVLKNKDQLTKKSVWIFGGDGWPMISATADWIMSLLPVRMSTSSSLIRKSIPTRAARLPKQRRPVQLRSLRLRANRRRKKTLALWS